MISVLWKNSNNKDEVILTKGSGETLVLAVNDFIRYEGRPGGVIIQGFTYKDIDPRGPIGMHYLPWRTTEKCWATPMWSLRGNMRHIITPPVGMMHYGQHINWDSVELIDLPSPPPSTPISP